MIADLVMVMHYHGVATGADGKAVTPENLNDWLNANGGYNRLGNVKWPKITEYSRGKVTFRGFGSANDPDLRQALCQFGPTIMQVDSPRLGGPRGHFVVGTGRDHPNESTWLINDPDGGVPETLQRKYSNRKYGTRKLSGPEFVWTDRLNGITVRLFSPAEVLLTDPLGRRAGVDPLTDTEFNEIPLAGYVEEVIHDNETGEPGIPSKELDIREPMDGTYEMVVTGTADGTYDLSIDPQDRTGASPIEVSFDNIPTAPGVVHHYTFNYSGTPGTPFQLSGGFDGRGQRPSDVNKFLTYANPTSARTELPAGQRSFPLLIFYGATILPETFRATLNGVNITGLFSPKPSGHETVPLSLSFGSNTLVLSSDGTTASGRVATDTDRLVFLVQ
jgi:hypothetical protein